MRIVSLLPSATEIVCGLGLGASLVGVTHECDYPDFVRRLPKVTRTLIPHDAPSAVIDGLVRERMKAHRALYSLDIPALESLRPDLIVTQALCDVCAVAEEEVHAAACQLPGRPRVVNLEPTTLEEVLASILHVGNAADCFEHAHSYVAGLQERIDKVRSRTAEFLHRPRVVVLEWIDPPFSCGHWSPELVSIAGGRECLSQPGQRARMLTWDEVVQASPDVMLLALCGFTLERTRQDVPILASYSGWSELPCVRAGRVFAVDGSAYFSRPGPRLIDSLELAAHALHPALFPAAPDVVLRVA
jgi:iron complex transport system substrate-binding protein